MKEPLFKSRSEAGARLAEKLVELSVDSIMVLAIPNGGLPVAISVANALGADLDLIISRKIPLPLSPEGGFGAIADNGSVILNESMVEKYRLNDDQIRYQIEKVKKEIKERSLLYRGNRPLPSIMDKTVIIVDDGLASGYTMLAAIKSLEYREPREIIAAAPVAWEIAARQVEKETKLVTSLVVNEPVFYISDYYSQWYDLSDKETLELFRKWLNSHPQNGFHHQKPSLKRLF
jgi:predicted phosphoribosyltransferase